MYCPKCGGRTQVTFTGTLEDLVARLRVCKECGHRFCTEEIEVLNDDSILMVYKRKNEERKKR